MAGPSSIACSHRIASLRGDRRLVLLGSSRPSPSQGEPAHLAKQNDLAPPCEIVPVGLGAACSAQGPRFFEFASQSKVGCKPQQATHTHLLRHPHLSEYVGKERMRNGREKVSRALEGTGCQA